MTVGFNRVPLSIKVHNPSLPTSYLYTKFLIQLSVGVIMGAPMCDPST